MSNKKVKARFYGIAIEEWGSVGIPTNEMVNSWINYNKDPYYIPDYDEEKKPVSLTADQLRALK